MGCQDPQLDIGALVMAAASGDRAAWEGLVGVFSGLVATLAEAHHLSAAESNAVSQIVWRRLAQHLGKIRQPDRVGAWLGAVTRDECVRILATSGRALARADSPSEPVLKPGRLLAFPQST